MLLWPRELFILCILLRHFQKQSAYIFYRNLGTQTNKKKIKDKNKHFYFFGGNSKTQYLFDALMYAKSV